MSDETPNRIRMARAGVRMSQADLARAMGETLGTTVSRAIVHQIEQGTRSVRLDELRAIAQITKQSAAWLMGEKE